MSKTKILIIGTVVGGILATAIISVSYFWPREQTSKPIYKVEVKSSEIEAESEKFAITIDKKGRATVPSNIVATGKVLRDLQVRDPLTLNIRLRPNKIQMNTNPHKVGAIYCGQDILGFYQYELWSLADWGINVGCTTHSALVTFSYKSWSNIDLFIGYSVGADALYTGPVLGVSVRL